MSKNNQMLIFDERAKKAAQELFVKFYGGDANDSQIQTAAEKWEVEPYRVASWYAAIYDEYVQSNLED